MILHTLLAGAFSAEELDFLRQDLRFATAMEHVYTAQDFERLRTIGRSVLQEKTAAPRRSRRSPVTARARRRAS